LLPSNAFETIVLIFFFFFLKQSVIFSRLL
jgi:hypothetical protein